MDWVNVNDSLPDKHTPVTVAWKQIEKGPKENVHVGVARDWQYDDKGWYSFSADGIWYPSKCGMIVTHWMSEAMPALPKEGLTVAADKRDKGSTGAWKWFVEKYPLSAKLHKEEGFSFEAAIDLANEYHAHFPSDDGAEMEEVDTKGMTDAQCRQVLAAIQLARELGYRDGHIDGRKLVPSVTQASTADPRPERAEPSQPCRSSRPADSAFGTNKRNET